MRTSSYVVMNPHISESHCSSATHTQTQGWYPFLSSSIPLYKSVTLEVYLVDSLLLRHTVDVVTCFELCFLLLWSWKPDLQLQNSPLPPAPFHFFFVVCLAFFRFAIARFCLPLVCRCPFPIHMLGLLKAWCLPPYKFEMCDILVEFLL